MQCTCALLPSASCPALHFSTLSYKVMIFQKKVIEHKMCFDFLYNWNTCILRRTVCDMMKIVCWPSCQVPCLILMKLEFSLQIFKKYSNIRFHEHLSSGTQVVSCGQTDTDRQTDMTRLTVVFCNFPNVSKNCLYNTQPLITTAMEVSFMYA
jgi:hypothetical protein